MALNGVAPNTYLPKTPHAPKRSNNRAQQVAPLVSPDTPGHCTSHIQSSSLMAQPHSQPRLSVRFIDKQDGMILPSSYARSSSPMSNHTRQLLSEAQKLAKYESGRTGRAVTAMDIILGSTRAVTTTQPYHCAAKTRFPHAHKTYPSNAYLGKMELYQLEQAAITVLAAAYSRKISGERFTSARPPNLDD